MTWNEKTVVFMGIYFIYVGQGVVVVRFGKHKYVSLVGIFHFFFFFGNLMRQKYIMMYEKSLTTA